MFLFLLVLLFFEWISAKSIHFFFFEKHPLKKIFILNLIPFKISVLFGLIVFFVIKFDYQYVRYTLFFYALSVYFTFLIAKIWLLFLYPCCFLLKKYKKDLCSNIYIKGFLIFLILGTIFISLYGMIIGKNKLMVNKIELKVEQLPESFDQFKIVQLSDLHLGSYWGQKSFIKKMIDSCNSQNPDLVIFSGDIVNQFSDELLIVDTMLKNINAPFGKYAVLGNHDFGDYTIWKSPAEKEKNTKEIIRYMEKNNFHYIRNKHIYIYKKSDSIALVGLDNWGLMPFKQYGDLKKATNGMPLNAFSLIISHDPTHWDEQIKKMFCTSLTFSGHTHAFQFGLNWGSFKWSPSKLKYEKWWGIYSEKNNYLYVSRGIGTIGFMGRIGMYPEIVVITLKSK